MPPAVVAVGAAAVGAGAGIWGASKSAKATKQAAQQSSDTAIEVAQMNNALAGQIYQQNLGVLGPYAALGLPAGTAINSLLGIATSPATGPLAQYGNGPAIAAGAPVGSPVTANPASPTAGPTLQQIWNLRHNGVSGDYDAAIAQYIASNPAPPPGYTGPSLAQIQMLRNNDVSGDYDAAMAAYMAAAQGAPAASATSTAAPYPGFPYAATTAGVAPATQHAAQVAAGMVPHTAPAPAATTAAPATTNAAGQNVYAGVPMPAARAARLEGGIYNEPVGIQPTAAGAGAQTATANVYQRTASGTGGRVGRPPVGVPGVAPAPAAPAAAPVTSVTAPVVTSPTPGTVTTPAPAAGSGGQAAYDAAFQNYLNSTGYKFQMAQGAEAINQHYAARGALQSGAAMKALQTYGQNTGTSFFKDYLGLLANQQAVGLSGAGAVAGVGTGYVNGVTANNNNAAQQQIAGYGQIAQGQSGLYGAIAGGIGGIAGAAGNALGSSYKPTF